MMALIFELPHRGGSNEYPQSMFWAEMWNISVFLLKKFQFLEVKFSIYLNRRVFVISYENVSTATDKRSIALNIF